jgi:retron-type reverse transcriptase
MKSYKNLFERIVSFENLLLAARKAQKGKRYRDNVLNFNYSLEQELFELQNKLINGDYSPGTYHTFIINDPKTREISVAPYRDRVVHHAVCNVIAPYWDKSMVHDAYACRKDKGTHKAILRFTEYARKNKYVLKCDIRKYFASIDHARLKEILFKKIPERKARALLAGIIDSNGSGRGLPIGNLTSQWFANMYLNDFDHWLKENIKCATYIRYMDDFTIFADDKKVLGDILSKIREYMTGLYLKLHENKCQTFRTADGVNFLGFRIYPTHRVLLKRNVHRVKRRLRYFQRKYAEGLMDISVIQRSLASWLGHVKWGDTYNLKQSILEKYVFVRG